MQMHSWMNELLGVVQHEDKLLVGLASLQRELHRQGARRLRLVYATGIVCQCSLLPAALLQLNYMALVVAHK